MVETIFTALYRPVPRVDFQIKLFTLPDSDIVPLNWLTDKNSKLAVIVPGLESNSTRSYIKNISCQLLKAGFDVLVIDHRGCRIPNKVFRSYHSGNTEDLKAVLESKSVSCYKEVNLIGFSLGGNIVLKYLGENGENAKVHHGVAVCAPYDLVLCSRELETKRNRIFKYRFVRSLKKGLLRKQKSFPDKLSPLAIKACRSLWDVDDLYTAPVHGFINAEDYYEKCSSKNFLEKIAIPTLLINAKNDPLVPLDETMIKNLKNEQIDFLITERGGHLGYPTKWLKGTNFYEKAIIDFFNRKGFIQEPHQVSS